MKKIDFALVYPAFVEAVTSQATKKEVDPTQLVLALFALDQNAGKERKEPKLKTRVKVLSLENSFKEEVLRLSQVSFFAGLPPIRTAILQILQVEVIQHNEALKNGDKTVVSITEYSHPIALDKLELQIEVEVAPIDAEVDEIVYKPTFSMVYDMEFLREYNLEETFGDADLDEIAKENGLEI